MGLKGLTKRPPFPSSETTVTEACRTMNEEGLGALAVRDGEELVGIFTYRDLIERVVLQKRDPEKVRLGEVMTPSPVSLSATDSYGDALRLMVERDYTYLPILDENGRLSGMLSLRSLLEHEIDHLASELDSVMSYLSADSPGGD